MMMLITYDVSNQDAAGRKRLRKVAKACENFGQRVQNSVFECLVDPGQFFRINRKYLIHLKTIKDIVAYSNSRLKLILTVASDDEIIVSREKVEDFIAGRSDE